MTDAARMEGRGCKSTSYVEAILGALELAIVFGRANGSLSAEKEAYWREQLALTIEKAALIPALKDQMFKLAEMYKDAPAHYAMGTGPNQGTVEEGALKIIEMGWVTCEAEELEDFLHGRYREVGEDTPMLIVAPKGESFEKMLDALGSSKEINAPTIVFTDDPNPLIKKLAKHVVMMPGGIDEYMTPLLYIIPMWLYGHHIGMARGTDPAGNRYGFIPTDYYYDEHYDAEGNITKPMRKY